MGHVSREELLEELRTLAKHLGRFPQMKDLQSHRDMLSVHPKSYSKRIGLLRAKSILRKEKENWN